MDEENNVKNLSVDDTSESSSESNILNDDTTDTILQSDFETRKKKNRIITILVIVIPVIIVAVILFCFFGGNSVEKLCAKGNYTEAFEKAADDDEKIRVIAENAVMYLESTVMHSFQGQENVNSCELSEVYYRIVYNSSGDLVQNVIFRINIETDISTLPFGAYFDYKNGEWGLTQSFYFDELDEYDTGEEFLNKTAIKLIIKEANGESTGAAIAFKLDGSSFDNAKNYYDNALTDKIELINVSDDEMRRLVPQAE